MKIISSGIKQTGITRLLFDGGFGALEVKPGVWALDLPGFPAEYKMGALATGETPNLLRKERGLDWCFPPM